MQKRCHVMRSRRDGEGREMGMGREYSGKECLCSDKFHLKCMPRCQILLLKCINDSGWGSRAPIMDFSEGIIEICPY